jgi:multiple antibiotic resistance protein
MSDIAIAGAAFAALLPITNPVSALAAFAGLTENAAPAQARRQARRIGIYVFAILAVSALLGSQLLHGLGITLPALQIAGGLVVGHTAFTMLAPSRQDSADQGGAAAAEQDVSFSPMAMPIVAGPGAIGVVIALAARYPGFGDRAWVVAGSAAIALTVFLVLRFGRPLITRIGRTGLTALTRIVGFLILAIGVELVVHGILAIAR